MKDIVLPQAGAVVMNAVTRVLEVLYGTPIEFRDFTIKYDKRQIYGNKNFKGLELIGNFDDRINRDNYRRVRARVTIEKTGWGWLINPSCQHFQIDDLMYYVDFEHVTKGEPLDGMVFGIVVFATYKENRGCNWWIGTDWQNRKEMPINETDSQS